jgi:hypothetical protein
MKFKEYIIQLTISVKMGEMGNTGFPEEFFLKSLWPDALLFQISKLLGLFLSKISFGLLTVNII